MPHSGVSAGHQFFRSRREFIDNPVARPTFGGALSGRIAKPLAELWMIDEFGHGGR